MNSLSHTLQGTLPGTLWSAKAGQASRMRADRRGAAIILVLGFMAISFGMAYALLRAQASSIQLEENYRRTEMARDAAMAGAMAGIRELHAADWGGVDSTLNAGVSSSSSYVVNYITGDSSLEPGDADYEMWPYRITVDSVGYAQDPADPLSIATSRVQVVLELIPENVATEPAIWSVGRQYTAFVAQEQAMNLNLLVRVEGASRFPDKLCLGKDSPVDDVARQRYMVDLEEMLEDGHGDYRQFDTDVLLPLAKQIGTANASETLPYQGLDANDMAAESTTTLPSVGTYTSYQLYPGGAHYTPGTLEFYTRNVTLGPDPKTNPLGIFYSSSNIRIESNVIVQGTIIDRGDIVIEGANISFQALDLPSIDGGTTPVQLPVMIVGDDVDVEDDTQMIVIGSIASGDRFRFRQCGVGTSFSMLGHLVAGELEVDAFTDWPSQWAMWRALYTEFMAQLDDDDDDSGGEGGGGEGGDDDDEEEDDDDAPEYEYFPDFLNKVYGYQIVPSYLFKPPASPVTLHWMAAGEPLYAPAEPDAGLRWQVIKWIDNP
ncbi:MAG: hypothetical protein MPJ50_15255 [Pirellulales bacterium]|nr:hypothetical protein [Pirellulales bacterium]